MTSDIEARMEDVSEKYAELSRVLANTDYAASALLEQNRVINKLESQVNSADRRLFRIKRKRTNELSEYEEYRNSLVSRLLRHIARWKRKPLESRTARLEHEYQELIKNQNEAMELRDSLRRQIDSAAKRRTEILFDKDVNDRARSDMGKLCEIVFMVPSLRFPRDNALRLDRDKVLHECQRMQTRIQEHTNVVDLLRRATEYACNAKKDMRQASVFSSLEFRDTNGISDMMERRALARASVEVKLAQTLATQAGIIEIPDVRLHCTDLLEDVRLNHHYMDKVYHQQILRGEQRATIFARYLAQCLLEARTMHGAFKFELERKESLLREAKNALRLERQRIVESVISRQTSSTECDSDGETIVKSES